MLLKLEQTSDVRPKMKYCLFPLPHKKAQSDK